MPSLLFDLSDIPLDAEPVFDKQTILSVNLQRHEMQQLDGVLWYDKAKRLIVGYKDVTEKEFWIPGHIPGRPLMPGVIMIESAAQLVSFFVKHIISDEEGFIGFAGIKSAKFRASVEPGCRLLLLGHVVEVRRRRYTCDVQGVVADKIVFDTTISGMRI